MRHLIAVAALVALLAVGCSSAPQPEDPSSPSSSVPVVQRGQTAPEFTLPDASGKPVRLNDFHGKPVLLYFSMGPG